jgi:RNA polymerase sigma-70 factor (ECF subfamily)
MSIARLEIARTNKPARYNCSPAKGSYMADTSEEALASLILKIGTDRDRDAFAQIFRHFAPRIKGFGLKQSSDGALAEELVQETMLAVWRSAKTYDSARSSAATWVFTICRNKRIDLFRRRSRAEPDQAEQEWETEPTQHRFAEVSADFRRTRKLMNDLPKEQSQVLAMSFLEEKPHREIAAQLGLPLGTVKSRIRLALTTLRQGMEQ